MQVHRCTEHSVGSIYGCEVTVRRTKSVAGFVIFGSVLLLTSGYGSQEKSSESSAKLPELPAYKLPKDEYLLLNARVGSANAEFIRKLRRVPLVRPEGIPTSLIFDKYLHRKSTALESDGFYLESDWLTPEELANIISVARHAVACVSPLLHTEKIDPVKLVIARKQADYYALVDAWADSDRAKREARPLASTIIGDFRCGYRSDALEVLTLAVADAVSDNLDPYLWNQKAIRQGLHTYVTSFVTLNFEHYAATDSTSPMANRESGVRSLFTTAREVLSRPGHDSLETVLRSDLNSLSHERLSVVVAFVHFILETQRDHLDDFLSLLAQESSENGKLKGPEGLWSALSKSISESFRMDISNLEKALQKFATEHYLHTEEIAVLLGMERECADSAFQGFVKICELKRLNKPISEKGEKLYQDILSKMERKLQTAGEKF